MEDDPQFRMYLDRVRRQADRAIEERTHERTMQTLKLAVLYGLVYVLAVALLVTFLGCGRAQITGPTTELEGVFFDIAQCYANHLELGPITFSTFEEEKPYCPTSGPCGYVACDAWPGTRHLECWTDWVNDPAHAGDFHNYAAHEVCHLAGTANEMEAELCAFEMVSQGVCS